MNKNNIAVFGIGKWGKNLARTFYNLNALKYINDTNNKQKIHNIKYKSKKYIYKNNNITAIIISTPINSHLNLAIKAITNNKHIFVEKPLTTNLKNLNILKNLNLTKKKIIMCGHLLLYHPAFIKIQRIINSKYIGKIKKIYSIRTNTIKTANKYDILWDYGPHDISIIHKLLNKKPLNIKILSQKKKFKQLTEINIKLHFKNNIYTKTFLSWHNNKKIQKLIIIGSKKKLIFDDTKKWEKKINILDIKHTHSFNIKIKKIEPLLNECKYFLAIIKTNKTPITNIKNSKKIIEILEKIKQHSDKI